MSRQTVVLLNFPEHAETTYATILQAFGHKVLKFKNAADAVNSLTNGLSADLVFVNEENIGRIKKKTIDFLEFIQGKEPTHPFKTIVVLGPYDLDLYNRIIKLGGHIVDLPHLVDCFRKEKLIPL
jgi:hypothetical protein